MLRRTSALFLCFTLLFTQSGFTQVAGELNLSGYLGQLRPNLVADKFRPLHLRYFSYDTGTNQLKLLLDKGDTKKLEDSQLNASTRTLLSYFLIGVTLPNDSFWVNLRPDSENNIIDDFLAQTDVGKILLEADLELKKDTAKFTSPQTPEGKEYWDKLYQKAGELFGAENITIPTLTRPWIVPGEVIIRETIGTPVSSSADGTEQATARRSAPLSAYIYKATLKVLLEQDHLKDSAVYNFTDPRLKALNEYSSRLIRQLIIPKLTKEVNVSKRYACLRQVYYSLILARWFKSRFYGKPGLYSSLIDKKDLTNLTSSESWSKTAYFKAYQKSFKEGEYNLQVPVSGPYGQVIRSYFSGGIQLAEVRMPAPNETAASPMGTYQGEKVNILRALGERAVVLSAGTRENLLPVTFTRVASSAVEDLSKESPNPQSSSSPMPQPIVELTLQEKLELNRYEALQIVGHLRNGDIIVITNWQPEVNMLGVGGQMEVCPPSDIKKALERARGIAAPYLDFQEIFSFDMLYAHINAVGEIVSSGSHYTPEDLIKLIELYRKGDVAIGFIPRARGTLLEGLRDKVEQLKTAEASAASPISLQAAELTPLEQSEYDLYLKKGIIQFDGNRHSVLRNWGSTGNVQFPVPCSNKRQALRQARAIAAFYLNLTEVINFDMLVAHVGAFAKGQAEFDSLLAMLIRQIRQIQAGEYGPENLIDFRDIADIFSRGALIAKLRELKTAEASAASPISQRNSFDVKILKSGWRPIDRLTAAFKQAVENELPVKLADELKPPNLALSLEKSYLNIKLRATFPFFDGSGLKNLPVFVRVTFNNKTRQIETTQVVAREEGFEILLANPVVQVTMASSALAKQDTVEAPGGIDFRTINIIAQPMGSFSGINFNLPRINNLESFDFDAQMQQIKSMVEKGIIPSEHRLKEYVAACYQKKELPKRIDDLVICLVDICKLEEEQVCETKPELKEILVILDTI